MRDHGKEDASPKHEFMALLASGALSPAMHQFLTSTLGTCGAVLHATGCSVLQFTICCNMHLFRTGSCKHLNHTENSASQLVVVNLQGATPKKGASVLCP